VISRDLFASYVRDALARFYDHAHLQTHPLVSLLVRQSAPEETRGQALRQLLTGAIESLRPAPTIPFGRPEWLGYRVLRLRYVESLNQGEICLELGIGRTSCYRHHQEAFEAVVSMLWERYERDAARQGGSDRATGLGPGELAREEAVKIARASQREAVSLTDVLQGVKLTIQPLAEQQGIDLVFEAPSSLPVTYGDPAMLRQIILDVLTEAMGLVARGELRLCVSLCNGEGETIWQVRGLDESSLGGRDTEHMSSFLVSRSLLNVYGGRFWIDRGSGEPVLSFAVPTARPKTILIIDDDLEAIGLYRRYLAARQFVVQMARRGDELQALLAETMPDLILLDVLMPREDGWNILQRLKATPETANIPVVICSVLSQPRLALALGAAAVLQKPIDQEMLLQTIQGCLSREDSGERTHPAGIADT
jgi:CheY-like chemotaxis protein